MDVERNEVSLSRGAWNMGTILAAGVSLLAMLPFGLGYPWMGGALVAIACGGVLVGLRSRRRLPFDELPLLQARCGDLRFRALLEDLTGAAVQGYDRHRRVVFWNEASEQLYGFRHEEALGRRLEELIIPEAMVSEVIRRHLAWVNHGIPIPAERLQLQNRDGSPVDVYSYHVMFDHDTDEPVMFCVDVGLDMHRIRHRSD